MMRGWFCLALVLLSAQFASAGDKKKDEVKKVEAKFDAKPAFVPYRLTDTNHTLVRIKINGKGPFNFIVDTGCPVLLIAEPVGKKIGLTTDKGWSVLESLELEGGLELNKVKARVETPFQIEGMNSMGLAGVELHGMIGYTVLGKYKMDFDYTKKQMTWCPVKTDPLPPMPIPGGAKAAAGGGMEMLISVMSFLIRLSGGGPAPAPQPRGFFGFEIEQQDKAVVVARVLADSPAAKAGLMKGDRIVTAGTREITASKELLDHAGKLTVGQVLTLTIERDKVKQELKIMAGDGL